MTQLIKFEYSLTEEELLCILDMASYGSNYWASQINFDFDQTDFIEVLDEMSGEKYNITKNQIEQCIVAIAENNKHLNIDNLFVKQAFVGKSLSMKRFRPRAKGRASSIIKPFSKLTIIVEERNIVKKGNKK